MQSNSGLRDICLRLHTISFPPSVLLDALFQRRGTCASEDQTNRGSELQVCVMLCVWNESVFLLH